MLKSSCSQHPRASRRRVDAVDVVRGIIMVLMALDHTRDYFGSAAASPTNLATATAGLFLTRWITNICAPVFFLLTGTGACLALERRGRHGLAYFLVTRGLWLILLEWTGMRLVWQFNLDYETTVLTVLWALGWSMIALAVLVYLPASVVTAIGLVMIATHNLFDPVRASALAAISPVLAPVWTVLHVPGFLVSPPGRVVFVAYPLVPWIGVTAVGYGLGQLYRWPAERRRPLLFWLGLAAIAGFALLRAVNVYGDPARWAPQRSAIFTSLSFLNTTKYPPSLLFLLMTLGPALLLLRALDGGTPRWLRPALIFGRVPFFFYVLHVLVIHALAVMASLARYGTARWMTESPSLDRYPVTQPPGWPAGLPLVYLVWAAVVLALYPLCRWYAALRQRRSDPWLSYL